APTSAASSRTTSARRPATLRSTTLFLLFYRRLNTTPTVGATSVVTAATGADTGKHFAGIAPPGGVPTAGASDGPGPSLGPSGSLRRPVTARSSAWRAHRARQSVRRDARASRL